ncbi:MULTISPECIES: hypothetical protein [Bradyrhizobium]|uniref:hypothetical protein n=1 Tax=Bradyrhizobium TaxID=374 RepID=UPI001BAC6412|nr:hypothetical protein [Bradyrhizobium liaoningense]MBR0987598.1 hypothetical protein [Bradyrhizobium liaoningense]GMO97933.1 hypothetical protein TM239_16900 [Bradyrhizobium sp. TM239]
MTDSGETAANAPSTQQIKAGFIRLLSSRIRAVSDDPQQIREIVYELARVKLLEQFTHADARESRELQQVLERAIKEVERTFERSAASEPHKIVAATAAPVPTPTPPPIPMSSPVSASPPTAKDAEALRRPVASPRSPDQLKRSGAFTFLVRLAGILVLMAGASTAVIYWPRLRTQVSELSQLALPSERAPSNAEPRPTAAPPESVTIERAPDSAKEPAPPAHPSMPLPTTFGVYALNEGQLQELKPVPGKIPDRRVAISAAINTPSATTLTSGDVSFIVFRPDGSIEASVTEVRVVAKVSRSMGIDASGKAAMVNAGDSWVIRSMSFPYKVGPVEDQPRMLLLQPEQDGFTLSPGRYVVVVKGMGYDFTVAGTVTDPNQCVERINAANGAFYSPCPPPRR